MRLHSIVKESRVTHGSFRHRYETDNPLHGEYQRLHGLRVKPTWIPESKLRLPTEQGRAAPTRLDAAACT